MTDKKQSNTSFDKKNEMQAELNDTQQTECGCATDSACDVDRRTFIKIAGLGAASLSASPAFSEALQADKIRHFIPADKPLSPEWIETLFAKGTTKIYRGEELKTIGMPVGGIATGQLYLGGDGKLLYWDIFNEHIFSGYGADCYHSNTPPAPIDQGFAIRVKSGKTIQTRSLDKRGFPSVSFTGEYPVGEVLYDDPDFPVSVKMKAFSPFVPLNAEDSSLPATVMKFTIKNTGRATVTATLGGWLENGVCFNSGREMHGERVNALRRGRDFTFLDYSAEPKPAPKTDKPSETFADFEGGDYGEWTVEGEAFGPGPARGKIAHQNTVSGYQGKGLVNTFFNGDDTKGRLVSPEFTIHRQYINFLVGGGERPDQVGISLIVDGKSVHTAIGQNRETLSWGNWDVREWMGKKAHIEIFDNATGSWGHINVDQIEFADRPQTKRRGPLDDQEDFGTMGLALLGGKFGQMSSLSIPDGEMPESLFDQDGSLARSPEFGETARKDFGQTLRGALGKKILIKPGQKRTVTFLLTWFFPNKWIPGSEEKEDLRGRNYANRFDSAFHVAESLASNYKRLEKETDRWRETYYDSTLPHWFLDRIHSTVSYMATSTVQWFGTGRFWGWEGVGCCHGTCSHVWNYAHAIARLFPELERNVRERQDLSVSLQDDGSVHFRGEFNNYCAMDGQAGTVLKCYREHLISKDDSFLKRNWPNVKKTILYLLGQDNNDDGLIESSQHNTFDINFFGPNTFVGSLYLAALRAAEEMAKLNGENEFAQRCHAVFEKGSELSVKRLFNGEYFIQDVDLKKHPQHQYGQGCLSDQLFGQGWADQLGLGYIYPKETVRAALKSIYKYNWATDIGPQNEVHLPERVFARPGEAGLFTCTWPISEHLKEGVRYKNEIWTGIEYQAAGHLLSEGFLKEGLAIIRGIHERYNGTKHNPFNEVECGDHYARALASWGCLTALEGFHYDGPAAYLEFDPRITPDKFRAPFTAAEGWGTLEQTRKKGKQTNTIAVRWGTIRLRSLAFRISDQGKVKVQVKRSGKPVPCDYTQNGSDLKIALSKEIIIPDKEKLSITISAV